MKALLAHYEAMSRYNAWMNKRLYALAGELTDDARKKDLGAFFSSLHGTLNHIVLADRIWLSRFGAGEAPAGAGLNDGHRLEFAKLTEERQATDRAITTYVASLTPEMLEATFSYKNMAGDAFSHPLWIALTHFFNHQTHHRGQATTLFMQLGKDPGVTDIIALLRGDVS